MTTLTDTDELATRLGERLEKGTLAMPVLPEIAVQVIDLFNEEDPDPKTMVRLVTRDPVLTAHLMKAANSPLLRAAAPITTVQQAVSRLGMRMVGVTTLSACLGPRLFRAPAYSDLIDRIWQQSLATAVWAREIARAVRRNSEVAFLCGMLHQVGKPVVLQAIQDLDGKGAGARGVAQVERLLEELSPRAVRRVATAWKLPGQIAAPMMHWQDFSLATGARDMAALIAVARLFADTCGEANPALEPEACDYPECVELQLDDRRLAALLGQAEAVQNLIAAMAA